jgi:hypothetical protein
VNVRPYVIAELVDANDRGQAADMTGTPNAKTRFPLAEPVIWRANVHSRSATSRNLRQRIWLEPLRQPTFSLPLRLKARRECVVIRAR